MKQTRKTHFISHRFVRTLAVHFNHSLQPQNLAQLAENHHAARLTVQVVQYHVAAVTAHWASHYRVHVFQPRRRIHAPLRGHHQTQQRRQQKYRLFLPHRGLGAQPEQVHAHRRFLTLTQHSNKHLAQKVVLGFRGNVTVTHVVETPATWREIEEVLGVQQRGSLFLDQLEDKRNST